MAGPRPPRILGPLLVAAGLLRLGVAQAAPGAELSVGADAGAPYGWAGTVGLLVGDRPPPTSTAPAFNYIRGALLELRVGTGGESLGLGVATSTGGQQLATSLLAVLVRTRGGPWLASPAQTLFGVEAAYSMYGGHPFAGLLYCPCDGRAQVRATFGFGLRFGSAHTYVSR
jgi:hypothetical protein